MNNYKARKIKSVKVFQLCEKLSVCMHFAERYNLNEKVEYKKFILTVLVFSDDRSGCLEGLGLSDFIACKDSELVFSSLL